MLGGILGMFGRIPFSCSTSRVLTFQNLNVSHSARYAQHEIIGETPVNEFIGPDRQKVQFKIQLRSQFGSSPALYVHLLNQMLESGKAYHLILGPDYFGKFILTSFEEERKYTNGIGLTTATDVSLSLEQDTSFNLASAIKL